MRKRLFILFISVAMAFGMTDNAFCGLGCTDEEWDIFLKEMDGELSPEEAADAINSLPMDQKSPDVQSAAEPDAGTDQETASVDIRSKDIKEDTEAAGQTEEKQAEKCSHAYTSVAKREPDCWEEGTRTFTCDICGDTYEQAVPSNGNHEYEEIRTEPVGMESSIVHADGVCGESRAEELEKAFYQNEDVGYFYGILVSLLAAMGITVFVSIIIKRKNPSGNRG